MTIQEYLTKTVEIDEACKQSHLVLNTEFVKEHSPFVVGDIIFLDRRSIEIEEIFVLPYYDRECPRIVYKGKKYNKIGDRLIPTKDTKKGIISELVTCMGSITKLN